MSNGTTEVHDRGVQRNIRNSGFRPQLFAVASGSYASNSAYGSGAASTGNYDALTLRGYISSQAQTSAVIRQHDRDVDFSLTLTLNGDAADPFGQETYDEVRLRVVQPLSSGEPGRYLNRFPKPDPLYPLPLFEDVEVQSVSDGVQRLPLQSGNILQARLLHGGELAFVRNDLTAGPPPTTSAILTSEVGSLLGGALGAGERIRFTVRGHYRASNNAV